MADPRIRPVDTGRLSIPSAGVDGMRVQGASMSAQSGGRNYSGNYSPELGTLSEVIGTIGPSVSQLSQLAQLGRDISYQQTAQRNQAELNQRAENLNISAGQFTGARANFMDSAATLSSLSSIATQYEQRAAQLQASQNQIATRNGEIQARSNQLMADLRNTRDRAQQTAIRNELTSLRNEAVQNSITAGNNSVEAQSLQQNMSQLAPQITSAQAQAEANRFLAERAADQLRTDVGQFGQSAQNAMNDQQAYMNFAIGTQYGNMSGNALTTMGRGFADIANGNFVAGTMGLGSATFNFSNVLAPSIAPFTSILQAGAFSSGLGIDTGSPRQGFDRFMEMTGTASSFDGMLRSISGFDRAYQEGNFAGMVASSLGMTGNSLSFGASIVNQTLGFLPEAQGIQAALRIGAASGELAAAAVLNLAADNAGFASQMTLAGANTILAMDSGSMGVVDFFGDIMQTFNNLAEGRGLNNPASPQWQQGLYMNTAELLGQIGDPITIDPALAYQTGLNNSIVVRNTDYSLLNPNPLTYTNLIDGPSAPLSFPWSQDPVNPFDPSRSDPSGNPTQTFQPSYQLPWNPNDPFNLNQYTTNPPSPQPPVNDPPPGCPTTRPRSRGRGTGNMR